MATAVNRMEDASVHQVSLTIHCFMPVSAGQCASSLTKENRSRIVSAVVDLAREHPEAVAISARPRPGRSLSLTLDLAGGAAATSHSNGRPGERSPGLLTMRELEVLGGVSAGLSNKHIARETHMKPETVKWHLKNVLRKLLATNRIDAVQKAIALRCLDANSKRPVSAALGDVK